ncbi:DUF732 domain-containing protein [Pseudonocardia abyssalis]|uniref:DUF732 domain-containing protein n=1 Tax=Pseudonocardia abyssalis TaxID=2792008 RepID=A0ABS6V2N6_9PSEU|nr:DUF732 domain-containing protein [Pseudonocardia abyssalis]MBW0114173.1 hypothetical protein [Pseudonocardia abyssalis]MBW0138566.1 hypothetical protein [Pseudonocardia abyssalis]
MSTTSIIAVVSLALLGGCASTGGSGEVAVEPLSPRQAAEQAYMAIIVNQGALTSTEADMIAYGDAACEFLANSSQVNGAAQGRRLAESMFVLQGDVSQSQASAIFGAAENSGLCES